MSTFHALSLKINEIEPFDPDLIAGYDNYELPHSYETVEGQKIKPDNSRLKLLTIMVTPGFATKCPVDIDALEIKEGQNVRVIMGGRYVVSIANPETKKFAFFNEPLRKKYIMPRVMMGVNMAMVAAVAGYILLLILKHQQSDKAVVIVEGISVFLFISSLIYSVYFYSNDTEAHTKLRQYLKKLLK